MKKIEAIVLLVIAGLVVVANLGLKDWVNGKNESVIKGTEVSAQDVVEKEDSSSEKVVAEKNSKKDVTQRYKKKTYKEKVV